MNDEQESREDDMQPGSNKETDTIIEQLKKTLEGFNNILNDSVIYMMMVLI